MAKVEITVCDICRTWEKNPDPTRGIRVGPREWPDMCQRCYDDAVRMIETLIARGPQEGEVKNRIQIAEGWIS